MNNTILPNKTTANTMQCCVKTADAGKEVYESVFFLWHLISDLGTFDYQYISESHQEHLKDSY